jgi:XRN 5'-3' exonuclease N-terminus
MVLTMSPLLGGLLLCVFALPTSGFAPRSSFPAAQSKIRYESKSVPITAPWQNTVGKTRKDISEANILHGIPKLFRWLVELYPIVLESVGEGLSGSNAMAVDNFYLDMNGIIHTCTHSNNDKLVMLNEREMFQRIFSYTDRLYKLVKPSRLMFLAVDGVAPRVRIRTHECTDADNQCSRDNSPNLRL